MNDFAKYFFCICGFCGFALFFFLALFIHRDPSMALFHGAVGCLLTALSGRALLGFALRSVVNRAEPGEPAAQATAEDPKRDNDEVQAQEKITADQMTEAVANPNKPIVEAQA